MNFNYSIWIVQTVAMLLTALALPKFQVKGPISALIMVIALGFINTHIWDAALFYQVPDNFTSKTILLFLSNGVLFWLLAKCLPGVEMQGILPAFIAPILFTFLTVAIDKYAKDIDWKDVIAQSATQVNNIKDTLKKSEATP